MTLEEFRKKFNEIRDMGFVRTLRKGPTGVGYTFEELLGIEENNIALPDIENVEIKTHRENSNNMLTLFTFNKNAWKVDQLTAIDDYGSVDKKGRLGMYYTLSTRPNSAGLFLSVYGKYLSVQDMEGKTVVQWELSTLAKRFATKIPAMVFVSAHTKIIEGVEYFHFYQGRLMSETPVDMLSKLFTNGDLFVDLRLHKGKSSARNHGSGFRVCEDKLHLLFNKIEEI